MARGAFTVDVHIKHDHFRAFRRQTHLGATRAAARLARIGVAAAKEQAPQSPGRGWTPHTRDAIEGRVIAEGNRIVAAVGLGKAWWGVFANQGTKPHVLNHGGQHPGQEAQHFMQHGLEAMRAAAVEALRHELGHPR